MIQKTLKTTTGKLKVQIPDKLDEVTLGQVIALQESPALDDLEAICILSGIPILIAPDKTFIQQRCHPQKSNFCNRQNR
jgi:hypothetical protein